MQKMHKFCFNAFGDNTCPMKKECPEYVRNLSKKITIQIPDISIVRKMFQKMSVSGYSEFVRNLLESGICPEFVGIFRNMMFKILVDNNNYLQYIIYTV